MGLGRTIRSSSSDRKQIMIVDEEQENLPSFQITQGSGLSLTIDTFREEQEFIQQE